MEKAKWQGNWLVEWIPETGSTNADLLAAVSLDVPHRYVLTTDHQTAGRGRLGRAWEAPAGSNLLVSILFRDVQGPLHRLTQNLGLATVMVLREEYGLDAGLKWPNDLVVNSVKSAEGAGQVESELKIAGILAQMLQTPAPIRSAHESVMVTNVVTGMGLNVNWAPPPDVADATCMANEVALLGVQSGVLEPHVILGRILTKYDELEAMHDPQVFGLYRNHLRTLGKQVRCQMPDGNDIVGRAIDVGIDGRLQVLDDCAITHHIDTADVMHLRRA